MVVTAGEAKDVRSLRMTSQVIAFQAIGYYFFPVIGQFLIVSWADSNLRDDLIEEGFLYTSLTALSVTVPFNTGHKIIAGLLNGCLVFASLGAAGSALYVASRSLYAISWTIDSESQASFLRCMRAIPKQTRVPARATAASYLLFLWLPFLQLKGDIAISNVRSLSRGRTSPPH